MAPKTYTSSPTDLLYNSPLARWAPSFFYFILPALLILGALTTTLLLPSQGGSPNGQVLASRFLMDPPAAISLSEARANLEALPTRLSKQLPAGSAWLLSDLPTFPLSAPSEQLSLLLPSHGINPPSCWLLGKPSTQTLPQRDTLALLQAQSGVLGFQMPLPASVVANQALCRIDQVIPGPLSLELWHPDPLAHAMSRTSRAIGLLEGGLLSLVAFVAIIALTMRERPYMLLALWFLGNLRIGAWAMGWDHQWLGHTLTPESLTWVRKLTVVLYFLVTNLLFTTLYRFSLEQRIYHRLCQISIASSLLLAFAMLVPSYEWFRTTCFIAAWLATALVSLTLIHTLMRFTTRARMWHTLGVVLALGVLLAGLITVGLNEGPLIGELQGTIILLLCNIILALAAADHIREARQTSLRLRNDLIAHDTLSPLGLFTLGATRHFEHLNPNACNILRIEPQVDLHALSWQDFFPQVDWLQVSLATEEGRDTEIQMRPDPTDAPPRSFLLRATLAGSRIEGSLQDISARTETLRKLRLMEDSDPLTDTLNRRGVEAVLQDSMQALEQSGTPCALAFLDLDHLKRVNDLFGHSAGDTLLQMVCERLRYSLTEKQHLGRVGNDEFIIVFPGINAREASHMAQDMIDSLNGSPLFVGERAFQLKTAIGIIDIDRGMHPKDAIAAASRACRDARKQHRDIVLYEENANELFDHIDAIHLFEQLERGLPPEDIYMVMQPIMSLRHPLRTINFETLLRVRSVGGRTVQTSKIIESAEDNGMITTLDKWVFSTTLDWLIKHQIKLGQTQQVNINISGVSLNDDRFIDNLFGLLNQQPQFTRRLCVEITEGVALQDLERTRQFMRRLQRMGARVALDDFGAGYTSFSYLKELPADMIKIDGSLIRDMLNSEANIAIVNSILDLAHNLGMECIAEWVEDLATLRALSSMGMDYVQGYAICAARPPEDMLAHDNILPLIDDPATRAYIEEISGRRIS